MQKGFARDMITARKNSNNNHSSRSSFCLTILGNKLKIHSTQIHFQERANDVYLHLYSAQLFCAVE